jgi:hypothetical protein
MRAVFAVFFVFLRRKDRVTPPSPSLPRRRPRSHKMADRDDGEGARGMAPFAFLSLRRRELALTLVQIPAYSCRFLRVRKGLLHPSLRASGRALSFRIAQAALMRRPVTVSFQATVSTCPRATPSSRPRTYGLSHRFSSSRSCDFGLGARHSVLFTLGQQMPDDVR